jgi:hypothetical protein
MMEKRRLVPGLFCVSVLLVLIGAAFSSLPDASNGIPAVKTWAQGRVSLGEKEFDESGITRTPSPSQWDTKVVYQIMVDRFNNGNLTNDNLNVPSQQRDQ